MKVAVITFIIILCCNSTFSQNVKRYETDRQYYTFNLSQSCELYFDSLIYDNHRPITILLKNDTPDTVIINYKSLISSQFTLRQHSSRYVKPGEYYSVSPIFNQERFINRTLLTGKFWFKFSPINDTSDMVYARTIRLYGNIILDRLPDYKEESYIDYIIASSQFPNTLKEERKFETKLQVAKFRKILRIYPKNTDGILPADLRLKYFLNNTEHYAKKRLDSANHIYFEVPSELGDSIFFIFNSSEHGLVAKKSFIRSKTNDLTISFSLGVNLNTPHYYDLSGNRVAVNKRWEGYYYIPRDDFSNYDFSQKRIDSLNALIKKYNAVLKYGLDGGFLLQCKPESAHEIKKELGDPIFHQLIDQRKWVTDYYTVFLSQELSKEKIEEVLMNYGITDFFVNYKESGNNEWTNSIYKVTIKLNNTPWNNSNNQLINELLEQKEILKIVQQTVRFPITNE